MKKLNERAENILATIIGILAGTTLGFIFYILVKIVL